MICPTCRYDEGPAKCGPAARWSLSLPMVMRYTRFMDQMEVAEANAAASR